MGGCQLVQVQEEDEDAELSEEFPRRHRRSSPGTQKTGRHGASAKSPLQPVRQKKILEVQALVGAEDTAPQLPPASERMLPTLLSVEVRDRQPWQVIQGVKEEHAPAVHVATAKAWYSSTSRYIPSTQSDVRT